MIKLSNFIEKNAPRSRILLLVLLDLLAVVISGFLALYIRYDFKFAYMDTQFLYNELYTLPIHLIVTLVLFVLFKLYRSVWRFASATEFINVLGACTGAIALECIYMNVLDRYLPISYYLLKYVILLALVVMIRFTYRFARLVQGIRTGKSNDKKHTMVVGGGEAGAMIIKELQSSRYLDQKVCCIIDDNKEKHGKFIRGIQIVGGRDSIGYFAHEYEIDEIIVAMPSVAKSEVRDI